MDTPVLVTGVLREPRVLPYYSAQFKLINVQHDDQTQNPVEILAQVDHGSLSNIPGLNRETYLSTTFKEQISAMAGDMRYIRQSITDKNGLKVRPKMTE